MSWKTAGLVVNNEDQDEIQDYKASDLGLHYLLRPVHLIT